MLAAGRLYDDHLHSRTPVHPGGHARGGPHRRRQQLADALEDYEYPVEIRVITERPFFHFKTNRKELTAAILAEKEKEKSSVA